MADYQIISQNGPYYTILVTVNGVEYQQTIVSDLKDTALEAFMQSYADAYQSGIDAQSPTSDN